VRPVNLLPEGVRKREPGKRPGSSYLLLGVLAVCLLLFAAYGVTVNQITSAERDAAEASAEAERLEVRAGALGPFADFAAVKQTRMASVQTLAQGRVDWERLMRELPRVMPEGSWLQTASASAAGDTAGDAAAAPVDPATAGATAGAPTANLTGCTRSQNDVAALMVRLREMHRVDDVTLTESAQEDAAAAPTLDSCGRFYQFDVTVSLGATPTREAPAGSDRVPATLGGGS
jgi:Tfp pilus assembly protein PilN